MIAYRCVFYISFLGFFCVFKKICEIRVMSLILILQNLDKHGIGERIPRRSSGETACLPVREKQVFPVRLWRHIRIRCVGRIFRTGIPMMPLLYILHINRCVELCIPLNISEIENFLSDFIPQRCIYSRTSAMEPERSEIFWKTKTNYIRKPGSSCRSAYGVCGRRSI